MSLEAVKRRKIHTWLQVSASLLLCLPSQVNVLWSLLPYALFFLSIAEKFIMCIVFHCYDDLNSFSEMWPYFLVRKKRYDFALQFKCFISQRREIQWVYWSWKYWKGQRFWTGTIVGKNSLKKLWKNNPYNLELCLLNNGNHQWTVNPNLYFFFCI